MVLSALNDSSSWHIGSLDKGKIFGVRLLHLDYLDNRELQMGVKSRFLLSVVAFLANRGLDPKMGATNVGNRDVQSALRLWLARPVLPVPGPAHPSPQQILCR